MEYSSSSAGLGTHATVDVVVGQGSSVIDFELRNNGYGYGNGDILTVPIGGLTGIPTTSSFSEFTLTVDKAIFDKFAGWSLGTLQVLDNVERFIDGARKDFPLSLAGSTVLSSLQKDRILTFKMYFLSLLIIHFRFQEKDIRLLVEAQ